MKWAEEKMVEYSILMVPVNKHNGEASTYKKKLSRMHIQNIKEK